MNLYARLRLFWETNQQSITRTVAIIVVAMFVVGQFIPSVMDLLIAKGVIAMLTLIVLLDLSVTVAATHEARLLDIAPDQDRDSPRTLALLQAQSVRRADLLEYSAASIEVLLVELKRQHAQIRLLIRHPDCVGPHQRMRIMGQITTLSSLIVADYDKAEVRCYRPFSGLRGRRFGDRMISVGWYTPDTRTNLEVRGHTNPVITAQLGSTDGQELARMFDEVFTGLWNAPDTEDAMLILGRSAP